MTHPAHLLALDAEDLSPEEVQARFAWARRQGRPAWLWPDVDPEAWREAVGRIASAAAEVLAGAQGRLAEGDPRAFGLAGFTSGLGPLVGWWVEQGRLHADAPIAAVFELHLRHNRLRSARLQDAARAVVDVLTSGGAAVAVLKGARTGPEYFPDPGVRPASDVDLLISPADLAAGEAGLAGLGYALAHRGERESSWTLGGAGPRSLTLAHAADPIAIDLHRSLDIFVGAGAPVAAFDRLDPMSSKGRWAPDPRALTLEQPLLLLHLAAHAGSGLHNLNLLRLVELALVIHKDQDRGVLSWEAFVAAGEKADALAFTYPALELCNRLCPRTAPDWVIARAAAAAPPAVRRFVADLTPASAHRVDRTSVSEHYMWSRGWSGRLRQLLSDLAPPPQAAWPIYRRRLSSLLRGRFSR